MENLDKIKKLRKVLNNEVLDELPYDIAEEVQDIFDDLLGDNFDEIQVKTYGDLVKVIQKYHLEDKRIITGCQGYVSGGRGYPQGYDDVYIKNIDKKIVISDSCFIDDDDLYYMSEN